MRISERAIALALVLLFTPVLASAAGRGTPPAPESGALGQGLRAFQAGKAGAAIPLLEGIAAGSTREAFYAQFYLGRIYAEEGRPHADHAKAYMLFQRIADAYADIDPDDDQRAGFVAKALVALAGYLRRGVADIGLKPDPERAAQYLHHAATFFADEDAQFELAKLYLTGDGVPNDQRRALHWFSSLSQKGHAGAQAFLADLYWRGRYVPRNVERALALATLAAESAPANERIWIEDIYQWIYCGVSDGERSDARGVAADWRQRYTRTIEPEPAPGLWPVPTRTCDDGRVVKIPGERNTVAASSTVNTLLPTPQPLPDAPAAATMPDRAVTTLPVATGHAGTVEPIRPAAGRAP